MAETTQATQQRPRVPIRELSRFNMFAPNPANGQRQSRLSWGVRDGNPRITVFTNTQTEKPVDGIITAAMNPETFYIFLSDLNEVALNGENGTKRKIDCFQGVYGDDGKITNERILASELYYGKDDNGIVWLSVISGNKPKVKFEFKVSDYHKFYRGNGEALSDKETSQLQTLAVVLALKDIYIPLVGQLRPQTANQAAASSGAPVRSGASSSSGSNTSSFEDIEF